MPVGAALLLVGVNADVVDEDEAADAELQLVSDLSKRYHRI